MSFFQPRRPRVFQHQFIYGDERKSRVAEMEQQITDAGLVEKEKPDAYNPERFRGTYVQATRHLRRRREREDKWQTIGVGVKIIAIVLLILIWLYIL